MREEGLGFPRELPTRHKKKWDEQVITDSFLQYLSFGWTLAHGSTVIHQSSPRNRSNKMIDRPSCATKIRWLHATDSEILQQETKKLKNRPDSGKSIQSHLKPDRRRWCYKMLYNSFSDRRMQLHQHMSHQRLAFSRRSLTRRHKNARKLINGWPTTNDRCSTYHIVQHCLCLTLDKLARGMDSRRRAFAGPKRADGI